MKVGYALSDSCGTRCLEGPDLARPFRVSPVEDHPSLTLRRYLEAAERALLKDGNRHLAGVLGELRGEKVAPEDIHGLHIHMVKHGALYHVSRVEALCRFGTLSFALLGAVTPEAQAWMESEWETLRLLERRFCGGWLPRALTAMEEEASPGCCCRFLIEAWLEGFHEWHLSRDAVSGGTSVRVWDSLEGERPAHSGETQDIFRQASRILTLFFDPATQRQIWPWHHAAGDFVVKGEGSPSVLLTTARAYRPLGECLGLPEMEPLFAWVYFLLSLTLRNRLDRLDGIGDWVLAGAFSVPATLAGFLDALGEKAAHREIPGTLWEGLLRLLGALTQEELLRLHLPILQPCSMGTSEEGRALLARELEGHSALLHAAIQALGRGGPPRMS